MMPALHDHPARHPREDECQFNAIRAQGAGGQNINKVSNAVHLRYDIHASSLPDAVKTRLLALGDQRISSDGVVVIKAQDHRSLERNKADALERLAALIVAIVPMALLIALFQERVVGGLTQGGLKG